MREIFIASKRFGSVALFCIDGIHLAACVLSKRISAKRFGFLNPRDPLFPRAPHSHSEHSAMKGSDTT
jgi:hypothetical protein